VIDIWKPPVYSTRLYSPFAPRFTTFRYWFRLAYPAKKASKSSISQSFVVRPAAIAGVLVVVSDAGFPKLSY